MESWTNFGVTSTSRWDHCPGTTTGRCFSHPGEKYHVGLHKPPSRTQEPRRRTLVRSRLSSLVDSCSSTICGRSGGGRTVTSRVTSALSPHLSTLKETPVNKESGTGLRHRRIQMTTEVTAYPPPLWSSRHRSFQEWSGPLTCHVQEWFGSGVSTFTVIVSTLYPTLSRTTFVGGPLDVVFVLQLSSPKLLHKYGDVKRLLGPGLTEN